MSLENTIILICAVSMFWLALMSIGFSYSQKQINRLKRKNEVANAEIARLLEELYPGLKDSIVESVKEAEQGKTIKHEDLMRELNDD